MRPIQRLAAAVIAASLLAACGGDDKPTTTTVATTARTTSTIAAGPTQPLTGRAGTPAARPALVVKIDNAPKARPQAGINEADVVVEEAVEGGITRLFAVFHSTGAAVVPVRSARSTDINLAAPLNRPLFAYSGANGLFLKMVRQAPLIDLGFDAAPKLYRRDRARPAPYNLATTTDALWGAAPDPARVPPALFSYGPLVERTSAATSLHLEFRGRVQTIVDYAWQGSGWQRAQDGTPHVDAAGRVVSPTNVIVQIVSYHDTGIRDQSGEPVPEADLIGEGEAWLLRDGRVLKGKWQKGSPEALTRFLDAAGEPMKLAPGQTWIELARTDAFGTVRLG